MYMLHLALKWETPFAFSFYVLRSLLSPPHSSLLLIFSFLPFIPVSFLVLTVTGQLADSTSRTQDDSHTSQLADIYI